MHAQHECHHFIGTDTEAGLLVELMTSRSLLLQSSLDPLNGVRGLGSRIKVLLEKATLYLCCKGGCVFFCLEGAFSVAIDCYDAAWTGHLKLERSIMWYCIKTSESCSSE